MKIITHMAEINFNNLLHRMHITKKQLTTLHRLPLRHRYPQADRSEFGGHSKPTFHYSLHRGYHSIKTQYAESTLHHGTKPDSTAVTQIRKTSECENNIELTFIYTHTQIHIKILLY